MTRQSCLQMSTFFSKGVIARVTLFYSMVAMSARHWRKAWFSCVSISWPVIPFSHSGLLGIVRGMYYAPACVFPWLSTNWPIIWCCPAAMTWLPETTIEDPPRSASNCFFDSCASDTNSSSEFCSSTDVSLGFLPDSIVVCYGNVRQAFSYTHHFISSRWSLSFHYYVLRLLPAREQGLP